MGLRAKRKKFTREAITLSARQLFFTNGYHGTSMNEIAEESGVAVGTLYNYFKSKSEIIFAITEENTKVTLAGLWDLNVDNPDISVEDVFWQFTAGFLRSLANYPRSFIKEMMSAFWTQDHSFSNGMISQDRKMLSQLARIVGKLSRAGRLREGSDPNTIALALYGMTASSVLWYSADENMTLEETQKNIAFMIGHFCRGILPAEKEN